MQIKIKSIICTFLLLFVFGNILVMAETTPVSTSAKMETAKSAILMEASTGKILYESNIKERLPIASVTKTMTMLLIMEALGEGKITLDDKVSTSEYAASMGGSQVFLEPGEQMPVSDMLKAIAVASGNDACVAMAEYISGSEATFVELMNKRASELGAQDTNFVNCNGLDVDNHYSSAYDVAVISRELLKHPKIHEYLTIWMDSLRGGEFGLANTNRLIRFYDGANGIKTGSTSIARFCLSASAKRENMQLIAVVLGAATSNERFESATKMLDYGFANYAVVDEKILEEPLSKVKIIGGMEETIDPGFADDLSFLVKKGRQNKVEKVINIEKEVKAPITKGQKIGDITFTVEGEEVFKTDIISTVEVKRNTMSKVFSKLLIQWLKV